MHDPAVFRSMHRERFHAEPAIFVGPGRVNLIGEHTDYAEGFVMPAAINFATLAGISPRTDGKIAIYSENYGEEATFDEAALPAKGSKHWSDYPMGVVSSRARGTRFPRSASAFGAMCRWRRGSRARRRWRCPRPWPFRRSSAQAIQDLSSRVCASGLKTSLWAQTAGSWTSSSA